METKKIKLEAISKTNQSSIGKNDYFQEILYLDTGSITKNKIESLQSYKFDKSFPSRARRKVKDKTIIYSNVRPNLEHYGFVENPPENLIVSTGFTTIDIIDDTIDPKFVYYYLTQKSLTDYLHTIASNSVSAYPSLNPSDLEDINIVLPIKRENQEKISYFLSILDKKIALNQRINAELEAMAKTLYDYWFVQFDFPNSDGLPYKSSGGKMVWNETLKREIPQGWSVSKIKDIAETASGGTPKSTEQNYYKNGDIAWINSGELNQPFIVQTKNFITQQGLNNSSAKLFPPNTLLLAMYGATAGKCSLLTFSATTNQAICAIMPKKIELTSYLKYYFDNIYNYLVNLSSGSARDNLSQEGIKNLQFIKPTDELLIKYHGITNAVFNKIRQNLEQNNELEELRDWLLPMLMNGQVPPS